MDEQIISPDLKFVKEIIASGGGSLKKCFQCAACSVVCNLTQDDKPFPRKEMMYAQWGLKDRLLSSPDIWLCHHCSDCTVYCPRSAKPGEVLGAIRQMAIKNYSPVSFLGKITGDPKYLFVLFALPYLIFLAYIARKGFFDISRIPRVDGKIVYSKFMSVPLIDSVFSTAAIFAAICFVMGARKYWANMNKTMQVKGNILEAVRQTALEVFAHRRFKKCAATKERTLTHSFVFYSFIGLAVTTTWSLIYLYIFKWESPYPLTDPLKYLGNASAFVLFAGMALMVINRLKNAGKTGAGSYFDWLFIGVIFAVTVTGILSEILRLADIAYLAYPVYFFHLVFVFFLFAYAPFSKMAHMVYRVTAMVFSRLAGSAKPAERE